MTGMTPATAPAGHSPAGRAGTEPGAAPNAPAPEAAARVLRVVCEHPCWSVFWDKRFGVWRAADDDPDSDLYATGDADTVISYIQANA